jgi:hypothetical protein
VPAEDAWVEVSAEGIDVMEEEVLELRALADEGGEFAVAEEVRELVPMAGGVEALEGGTELPSQLGLQPCAWSCVAAWRRWSAAVGRV